jgi:hypothetical protein
LKINKYYKVTHLETWKIPALRPFEIFFCGVGVKEDEMDGAYSTHGRDECIQYAGRKT